jgi:hypothetical protein
MSKIFKFIGFLFSWVGIFAIIYINHIVLVETTKEIDIFGLLIGLGAILGFVKMVDERIKVWDIQNRNKIFRISWTNGKKILLGICITWVLYTVEDDLPQLQWTATLICASLIIGYIFTLIGNLIDKKRVAH